MIVYNNFFNFVDESGLKDFFLFCIVVLSISLMGFDNFLVVIVIFICSTLFNVNICLMELEFFFEVFFFEEFSL